MVFRLAKPSYHRFGYRPRDLNGEAVGAAFLVGGVSFLGQRISSLTSLLLPSLQRGQLFLRLGTRGYLPNVVRSSILILKGGVVEPLGWPRPP